MRKEERTCNGLDSWDIEAWIIQLGSFPIRRHKHAQGKTCYSVNEGHLLELENGKWAVVTEEGCSCYSSSDASVNVYPDKRAAEDSFDVWVREDDTRKVYED